MKKIASLLLAMLLLIGVITPVMANNNITVKIDGQQISFDVQPQLINGRTMVPLRAIFEALGATVDWNNDTQTVTATKGGTTISLTINNPTMYVNGAAVTLDSPACLVGGRTLVPVRAISEAFGTKVDWDGNNSTVLISSSNYKPNLTIDDAEALKLAQDGYQYIKSILKNPASLQLHSAYAGYVEINGTPRLRVLFDLSAMNGFGGYSREGYRVFYSITDGRILKETKANGTYTVNDFVNGYYKTIDLNKIIK